MGSEVLAPWHNECTQVRKNIFGFRCETELDGINDVKLRSFIPRGILQMCFFNRDSFPPYPSPISSWILVILLTVYGQGSKLEETLTILE